MEAPMTIVMLATFLVLAILSVPIGWALGMSAVVALMTSDHPFPIAFVAARLYNANNSFVLMSLPFFILAGNIMSKGGLSQRLINLCKQILGPVDGGLGIVSVLTAFLFSTIAGSNAATTAAVGGMMIPELEKNGYKKEFSAATVAAAGTTGMVVPPSSAMVVYAACSGASLPALFIGGIVPGILMSISMMVVVYFVSKKQGIKGFERGSKREILKSFVDAIGAIIMPLIVLGGIYSGVFTATEAAVVAVVYALIVTVFVYRDISIAELPKIFCESAITSAVGMVVISCASLVGYVLTLEHVPQQLCEAVLKSNGTPLQALLLINVVLLLAGCLITPNSAIIILVPILIPICKQLGISPVVLGIIMIVNLSIGAITPPVGGDVFIASSIAKVNVEKIFKYVTPFLIVLIIDLILLNCFNDIILILPKMLGLM